MFSILEKYGNQKQAITYAKKLILNHSCNNFSIHIFYFEPDLADFD